MPPDRSYAEITAPSARTRRVEGKALTGPDDVWPCDALLPRRTYARQTLFSCFPGRAPLLLGLGRRRMQQRAVHVKRGKRHATKAAGALERMGCVHIG
jgi:hypothetical protein